MDYPGAYYLNLRRWVGSHSTKKAGSVPRQCSGSVSHTSLIAVPARGVDSARNAVSATAGARLVALGPIRPALPVGTQHDVAGRSLITAARTLPSSRRARSSHRDLTRRAEDPSESRRVEQPLLRQEANRTAQSTIGPPGDYARVEVAVVLQASTAPPRSGTCSTPSTSKRQRSVPTARIAILATTWKPSLSDPTVFPPSRCLHAPCRRATGHRWP